jgi:1-deoxy-D-xylulose-5-phosphate synthase
MLYTGFMLNQPVAVRYPRGTGPGVEIKQEMTALPIGRAEVKRVGQGIAILAFGSTLTMALEAGKQLDATVVNMRFIKPLDTELILRLALDHDLLVTTEENAVHGGAGSSVNEVLMNAEVKKVVLNHGLTDALIMHGSRTDILKDAGLTSEGLLALISRHTSVIYPAQDLRSAKSSNLKGRRSP